MLESYFSKVAGRRQKASKFIKTRLVFLWIFGKFSEHLFQRTPRESCFFLFGVNFCIMGAWACNLSKWNNSGPEMCLNILIWSWMEEQLFLLKRLVDTLFIINFSVIVCSKMFIESYYSFNFANGFFELFVSKLWEMSLWEFIFIKFLVLRF